MSNHEEVIIFVRLALRLKHAPNFLNEPQGEQWLKKYLHLCEVNNRQLRKAKLSSEKRIDYRIIYFIHDDLTASMSHMIKIRLITEESEVVEIDGDFNKGIIEYLKSYEQDVWQMRLDADDLISYSAIQRLSTIENANLVFFNRGFSVLFPDFKQIVAVQEIWKETPPFLALKSNKRSVYEFKHDKWPLTEFKTRVLEDSSYWIQFVHGSNRSNAFGGAGWLVYKVLPRNFSILKKYFEFIEFPVNHLHLKLNFARYCLLNLLFRHPH